LISRQILAISTGNSVAGTADKDEPAKLLISSDASVVEIPMLPGCSRDELPRVPVAQQTSRPVHPADGSFKTTCFAV